MFTRKILTIIDIKKIWWSIPLMGMIAGIVAAGIGSLIIVLMVQIRFGFPRNDISLSFFLEETLFMFSYGFAFSVLPASFCGALIGGIVQGAAKKGKLTVAKAAIFGGITAGVFLITICVIELSALMLLPHAYYVWVLKDLADRSFFQNIGPAILNFFQVWIKFWQETIMALVIAVFSGSLVGKLLGICALKSVENSKVGSCVQKRNESDTHAQGQLNK